MFRGEIPMPSLLSDPANFFWFSIAMMVCVPVAADCWRKVRKHELDADLKRDMIGRGMSADEIERILAARSDNSGR
jgi:hypothetical protein